VSAQSPDYLNAARNSAELVFDRFQALHTRLHKHTPYALKKSVLGEIEKEFWSRFKEFRANKFRAMNDLNVTSLLYHAYALQIGVAREADMNCAFVSHNSPRSLDALSCWRDFETVCVNEGQGKKVAGWYDKTSAFYSSSFSFPAAWEKG
jgi:hypothetical protein